MGEKMSKADVLTKVQEAYNRLDEAMSEIKDAGRAVEQAEDHVKAAFNGLEEIPEDASDIGEEEEDAKD